MLVLDEPTNDLDIETLELLEAQLVEWPGTLLLVSHDRAFLDNVVTSTFVFEGHGRIQEYVGGYDDWVRQRAAAMPPAPPARRQTPAGGPSESSAVATKKKLSYKEQRELADLPARIEVLEAEQSELNATVSHPEFYRESAEAIARTLARIAELQHVLDGAYARWDELDSRPG